MARRNLLIGAIFVVVIGILAVTEVVLQQAVTAQEGGGTVQAPRFEVDPFWPKPLPNHWLLGSAIGVWVDERTTSGSSIAARRRSTTTRRAWS